MVQYHRYHQLRKDDVEGAAETGQAQRLLLVCGEKKSKRKFLPFLFIFSVISCSLVFAPRLSANLSALNLPFFGDDISDDETTQTCSPWSTSSTSDYYLCCDRTSFRSDVCYMSGDIRTHSATFSIFVHPPPATNTTTTRTTNSKPKTQFEKIRPYTRKWETSVMNTINELNLVKAPSSTDHVSSCDFRHTVPAIFLSTGGYTGNVYHEFNDGLIPLYITSKHFNKRVVFVILEYHTWWLTKYGDILSHLSAYPPVDFSESTTHCFPSAIAGLHIHDELSIDPAITPAHPSILDFRRILDAAYAPRIQSLLPPSSTSNATQSSPKLVLISRNGSRSITNEAEVVAMAEEVGFSVEVVRPGRTTELAKLYRTVNSSDAVIGAHGAAMTHFLFMRPGTALVQVIPLGTEWAAENYYGGPAVKMGLKYMGYKIWPKESSLYGQYERDDPVLRDPESVNQRGWEVTKKVYLDGQTVNLDIVRFRRRLMRVYMYCLAKRRREGGIHSF